MRGLIGRKVGMTQVFDHEGRRMGVTVLRVGPCTVLQVKSENGKDGYGALVEAFEDTEEKKLTRPELGKFKHAGISPKRVIREFRMPQHFLDDVSVGDELTCEMFQVGDFVDVVGTSKGKGFTGVMKRHNMLGTPGGHGCHEYFRHGGSIGMHTYPGRVMKGKRMAGQHGNSRVTVQNIRVVGIDGNRNLVLLEGGVPGANGGVVMVKASRKKDRQGMDD